MVEVFATNIQNVRDARILLGLFGIAFPTLKANFDLADVDRILRIESKDGAIDHNLVLNYVRDLGYAIWMLEE